MATRVLMMGPGEGIVGGISALTQTVVPVLQQRIDLQYFATVRNRPANKSGSVSLQNMALTLSQYARFLRALIAFHPQIIHVHTSKGIAWLKDTFYVLVGKIWRCRVILHMHGGNFVDIYQQSGRLAQRYTRLILSLADAIIEVSAERKQRLAQVIPIERIIALRNCIDTDAIPAGSCDGAENGMRVLFLGVVGQNKGVFDLLRAWACLGTNGAAPQLWIAGHEECEGDLAKAQALAQELSLETECHFAGVVSGAAKAQLLRESDVLVLPSYREALPMAILEAMAAGLPIVATKVGGIPEVVQDGYNGFLIAPGDVDRLAQVLAGLAGDPQLRETMGSRSREIAERDLDVKPYVKRLVDLYETLTH